MQELTSINIEDNLVIMCSIQYLYLLNVKIVMNNKNNSFSTAAL